MALLISLGSDLTVALASVGIVIFWAGYMVVHLIALVYGKFKLHRKINLDAPREKPLPGVSILKPLVGVDSNLYSNLETFFTLKYPKFELLFCLHHDSDPALMLVRSLIEKYPNVDAAVFVGGKDIGLNPKIKNIWPAYDAAKHEYILISDSGIRMKEDTLVDIVEAMTDRVGIVTQMPFCCDRKGFAATLEKVWFGTAQSRIYLSAHCLGVTCSTGMSSLMRKKLLDDVGGLQTFCMYIAEDYFFAQSIVSRGWKSAISSQPAWQNSGNCQVTNFHNRLARWTKLRIAMLPHTILLEPLQECVLLGLLVSLSVNCLFEWNSLVFFLIHILIWMLLDYCLLLIIQNGPMSFGKFEFIITWLYREFTAFPMFVRAILNKSLTWRTGSYRLRWGGVAEEIQRKPPQLL